MSKEVVHNPQQVIGQLARIKPRGAEDRLAISNAIACLNHMQNVCQRQRKQLASVGKMIIGTGAP
jgi:hypothetical protein